MTDESSPPAVSTRSSVAVIGRRLLDDLLLGTCPFVPWNNVCPGGNSRPEHVVPLPKKPIAIERSQTVGRADAPVVIVEYSDFQCPFCVTFARNVFPELERKYVAPGEVLFAFMNFPLEEPHPMALQAAQAAACAARAGQFSKIHAGLFGPAQPLSEGSIRAVLLDAAIAHPDGCFNEAAAATVRTDRKSGADLGFNSTPTFVVGTANSDGTITAHKTWSGVRPLAEFESAIRDVKRSAAVR